MTKHLNMVVGAALTLALVAPARLHGQAEKYIEGVPLKVQIVLSRYQGEKKVSSMPYTLSFNAMGGHGTGSLRMGSKIPIKMISAVMIGGEKMPTAGPITYQDIGTNIDCTTLFLGGDRYSVAITVDDTSVYGDESGKQADQPSFRSFRVTSSMVLKNGETGQFTSAVDKVNGEVTRIDVTLTVGK